MRTEEYFHIHIYIYIYGNFYLTIKFDGDNKRKIKTPDEQLTRVITTFSKKKKKN